MSQPVIRILTDSACDIPFETEKAHPCLTILPIPLTVDGKGYYERVDFTFESYYDALDTCKEVPCTAHITNLTFLEQYEKAWQEGCTHLLHVTIYSGASNMYDAAHQARQMFCEEHPEAQMEIRILDSNCYSMGYGYPLVQAAKMIEAGQGFEEICAYVSDYLSRLEIYFSPFTLRFVKKSGRISCAAAFVGDLLGLRPIISAVGTTSMVDKVRGNAAVVSYLTRLFEKNRAKQKQEPYLILTARMNDSVKELAAACEKAAGYPPEGTFQIGAAVSTNTGPDIVGITFLHD